MIVKCCPCQDWLDLDVDKHNVSVWPQCHLSIHIYFTQSSNIAKNVCCNGCNNFEKIFWNKEQCWYLKGEWATERMFSVCHDGNVAPLHGQPVGKWEHWDGRVVRPTRVQLKKIKNEFDYILHFYNKWQFFHTGGEKLYD